VHDHGWQELREGYPDGIGYYGEAHGHILLVMWEPPAGEFRWCICDEGLCQGCQALASEQQTIPDRASDPKAGEPQHTTNQV